MHNGTCVKETVQECQSTVYRSNPLPSEDQTKYKFVKMNGNYDPNYSGYDQWAYVEPEYWDDIIEGNDDGKGVCIWTCADGYVINDENNPTKCIPADACGPAKDYTNPRKSKSKLCNEGWNLKNGKGKVTFEKGSYNTDCSVINYEWECEAGYKTKSCSKSLIGGVGVRVYSEDGKITMSSNYYSQNNIVNNAPVEQPLTAKIRYYSTYDQNRDLNMTPAGGLKILNLQAGNPLPLLPLPGYDINDGRNNTIWKFQAIEFDPVAYEIDGTEYIIYPRWSQQDSWYYFENMFSCPGEIEL